MSTPEAGRDKPRRSDDTTNSHHPDRGSIDRSILASLMWLRVLVCLYVTHLNLERISDFTAPTLAAGLTAVMLVWTAVISWAYRRLVVSPPSTRGLIPNAAPRGAVPRSIPPRRAWSGLSALLALDLGVSLTIVLASLVTHSEAMRLSHEPTIASYWLCLAPLTIAALRGPWWGLGAAAAAAGADLATRLDPTADIVRTLGLLCAACLVVGITATTLRSLFIAKLHAERAAAALRERERLARTVHDGVIQVLTLTQRAASRHLDNTELTDLAREAAVQETALRALIQSDAREAHLSQRHGTESRDQFLHTDASTAVDVTTALEALARAKRNVSTPGYPVHMPAPVVEELLAAVAELLRNIDKHAPGAHCWILLEDEASQVRVTVRDNGPGIPDGRLEAAAAQGHLGVSGSVQARMHDLGGTALLHSDADGTEWELTCPC